MLERSFEKIAREFSKKGLTGIMEAKIGKTTSVSVPMSPRCVRLWRKKVATKE